MNKAVVPFLHPPFVIIRCAACRELLLSTLVRKFGGVLVIFWFTLFYVIPEGLIGNMVFCLNRCFHCHLHKRNHIPDRAIRG
jgi:hypothetical protein